MFKYNKSRRSAIGATIFCAILLGPLMHAETSSDGNENAKSPGNGTISGTVFGFDDKAKAAGAVVHAFHVDSEKVFSSAPTGGNGEFSITEIPTGYLDLAVEFDGVIYLGDQVLNMSPSGKMVLRLSLAKEGSPPPAEWVGDTTRQFPETDLPTGGIATLNKKLRGKEFWKSPKGIAIITGGAGAALLTIAVGSDETPASYYYPYR